MELSILNSSLGQKLQCLTYLDAFWNFRQLRDRGASVQKRSSISPDRTTPDASDDSYLAKGTSTRRISSRSGHSLCPMREPSAGKPPRRLGSEVMIEGKEKAVVPADSAEGGFFARPVHNNPGRKVDRVGPVI